MSGEKRYGLILPGNKTQKKIALGQVSSIFDDDKDDVESGIVHDGTRGKCSKKNQIKRQVELEMEKALMEDPNVYEYDNIYDDIHSKKIEVKKNLAKGSDGKPKYIGNLLKAAEDRKKEMERRLERKIHKEREAEKGKFDDRDAFVTDSYRQKMEQMRKDEELERLAEEREAKLDVTKQSDMTGFYRHLLKQATDESPDNSDHANETPNSKSVSKDDSVNNSRKQEETTRLRKPHSPAEYDVDLDLNLHRGKKDSHTHKERCSVDVEQRGKDKLRDSRNFGEKRSHDDIKDSHMRVKDTDQEYGSEQPGQQCSDELRIAPKRKLPSPDDVRQTPIRYSKTMAGDPKHQLGTQAEDKIPPSLSNALRRTTSSSLDDARARFMARRTTRQVPISTEDSD